MNEKHLINLEVTEEELMVLLAVIGNTSDSTRKLWVQTDIEDYGATPDTPEMRMPQVRHSSQQLFTLLIKTAYAHNLVGERAERMEGIFISNKGQVEPTLRALTKRGVHFTAGTTGRIKMENNELTLHSLFKQAYELIGTGHFLKIYMHYNFDMSEQEKESYLKQVRESYVLIDAFLQDDEFTAVDSIFPVDSACAMFAETFRLGEETRYGFYDTMARIGLETVVTSYEDLLEEEVKAIELARKVDCGQMTADEAFSLTVLDEVEEVEEAEEIEMTNERYLDLLELLAQLGAIDGESKSDTVIALPIWQDFAQLEDDLETAVESLARNTEVIWKSGDSLDDNNTFERMIDTLRDQLVLHSNIHSVILVIHGEDLTMGYTIVNKELLPQCELEEYADFVYAHEEKSLALNLVELQERLTTHLIIEGVEINQDNLREHVWMTLSDLMENKLNDDELTTLQAVVKRYNELHEEQDDEELLSILELVNNNEVVKVFDEQEVMLYQGAFNYATGEHTIEDLEEKIYEQQDFVDMLKDNLEAVSDTVDTLEDEILDLEDEVEELEDDVQDAYDEWMENDEDDEPELDEELEAVYDDLTNELDEKREELSEKRDELEEEYENEQHFHDELDDARKELESLEREYEDLTRRLDDLVDELREHTAKPGLSMIVYCDERDEHITVVLDKDMIFKEYDYDGVTVYNSTPVKEYTDIEDVLDYYVNNGDVAKLITIRDF